MPALPLPHNLIPYGGYPPITRMKVENVDGGEVKVYFSRDTTKKLEACNASGTDAGEIEKK